MPLTPGQRVRVTLSSRVATGPLQGTVVSALPDTVTIEREEGGARRISRTQIDRIEVSVARVREPEKAAGYGILAAAPLLVLAVILSPIAAGESGSTAIGIVLVPLAAVAAVGAAIGSGKQDVWVEASWPTLEEVVPADTTAADL